MTSYFPGSSTLSGLALSEAIPCDRDRGPRFHTHCWDQRDQIEKVPRHQRHRAISRQFEHSPLRYALETDCLAGRLPVMNRDKRLVGIVSLADLAIEGSLPKTAKALHGISQPGGQHNQSRPSA
jgi:hypothetical protein